MPPHGPRNHINTPYHSHCNDSPGRNIMHLSSTIATQPIQMPVTPHPRRGHSPPTRCSLSMPPSSPPPRCPPGHDSQQSSTTLTLTPNPSLPNHLASASSPSPSVHERETCTSQPLQAKHNPPAEPVQAQDMLHRPTYPTTNRSPVPGQGIEPHKEALEEGHHSTPRTRHPTIPTPKPKPRRCPSMPTTHTPTRYTPLYQAR
ncbi:hypothetical protein AMECASPLE_033588 [Ameca splendens]|uniref:Uncharacterized protein n=1 Tax=Ameca splendens TaxID=208324 RepID=A0ABV0ZFP4_9TELE